MRLHGQFQRELETRDALDRRLLDEAAAVGAEIRRGVMRSDPSDPVEREARRARQEALERRPARLRPALHIAGAADHVGPVLPDLLRHPWNDVRRIGKIRHRRDEDVAPGGLKARADREGHSAAQRIAHELHRRRPVRHRRDHGQLLVLVEVVADQDLVLPVLQGRGQSAETGRDVSLLVVDGRDHADAGRGHGLSARSRNCLPKRLQAKGSFR